MEPDASGHAEGEGPQEAERDPAALPGPDAAFADRLNWLFASMHPAGKREYKNAHVVRSIVDNPGRYGAVNLTDQYLSLLRKGQRQGGEGVKKALALFFGVPAGYLIGDLDPARAAEIETEVQFLARTFGDENVKAIATRSFGLPANMQNLLLGILDQMRDQAGLPKGPSQRDST